MTITKNFLGIPIDGDITKGDRKTPQRPLSDLEPLIRAVLDDPTIHSFGWEQYTPYYNDGEPCTFSVGHVWVKTVGDVEKAEPTAEQIEALDGMRDAVSAGLLSQETFDEAREKLYGRDEDEDDEEGHAYTLSYTGHPTLGTREVDYVGDWPNRTKVYGPYVGPDEARYNRCRELVDAIGTGAFDDVLLDAFGDHARVVVKATGITVDEYSHD